MALITLDKNEAPKFYGGREMLATALGYDVPDEPSEASQGIWAEHSRKERAKAFQAVKQTVNRLISAGAITRVKDATFRSHAEYALNLSPGFSTGSEGVTEQPPVRVAEQPPKGVTEQPLGGHSMTSEGVGEQPPNEYEEEKGSFIGMPSQPANGSNTGSKFKTLMNDSSSQSEEQERNRQMRALENQMSSWGKL